MPEKTFTVVVPTRNRAALLRDAIASVLAVNYPPEAVELVVVDNASTDDTRAVVEAAAAGAPFEVRYVHQPKLGSSAARNAGIREARGRTLFFTDDDQVVAPDVLREHERVLTRYGVSVAQGGIALKFPDGRPPWIHGILAGYLGETAKLPEGLSNIHIFTGNFVAARAVFDRVGLFNEDLGKGQSGYSEDVEMGIRIRAAGFQVAYAPTALIYHVIPAARATDDAYRRSCLQKGFSEVLSSAGRSSLPRTTLAGLRALRAAAFAAVATAVGDHHRALKRQTHAAEEVGRFAAHVARRFPATAPALTGAAKGL